MNTRRCLGDNKQADEPLLGALCDKSRIRAIGGIPARGPDAPRFQFIRAGRLGTMFRRIPKATAAQSRPNPQSCCPRRYLGTEPSWTGVGDICSRACYALLHTPRWPGKGPDARRPRGNTALDELWSRGNEADGPFPGQPFGTLLPRSHAASLVVDSSSRADLLLAPCLGSRQKRRGVWKSA
jgi:hypothetical protein